MCEHKVITGFVLISFTYHHTGLDNPATAASYELYAHVLFTNISLDLQEQTKHKNIYIYRLCVQQLPCPVRNAVRKMYSEKQIAQCPITFIG